MRRKHVLIVACCCSALFLQGCGGSSETAQGAAGGVPAIPTQTNLMFSNDAESNGDGDNSANGISGDEGGDFGNSESGDANESDGSLVSSVQSSRDSSSGDEDSSSSGDTGSGSSVTEVIEDSSSSGTSTTTTVVTTTTSTTSSSTGDAVDTSTDLGAGRGISVDSFGRAGSVSASSSKAFDDLVEEADILLVKAVSSLEVGRATSVEASQSAESAMASLSSILSSLPNLETLKEDAEAANEPFAATQLENAGLSFQRAKLANDLAAVSLVVSRAEEALAHAQSLASPSTPEDGDLFRTALQDALSSLDGVSQEAGSRAGSAKSAADLIMSAMSKLTSAAGSVSGTLRDDIILFEAKTDVPHASLVNSKDTWGTAQVNIDLAMSQVETALTKMNAALSRRRLSIVLL